MICEYNAVTRKKKKLLCFYCRIILCGCPVCAHLLSLRAISFKTNISKYSIFSRPALPLNH